LSQKKLDVGYSDKTPLLQAKVDYSAQQVNILTAGNCFAAVESCHLNQLIRQRCCKLEFDVLDTIEVNYVPNLQSD
jgi:hypothetical protein